VYLRTIATTTPPPPLPKVHSAKVSSARRPPPLTPWKHAHLVAQNPSKRPCSWKTTPNLVNSDLVCHEAQLRSSAVRQPERAEPVFCHVSDPYVGAERERGRALAIGGECMGGRGRRPEENFSYSTHRHTHTHLLPHTHTYTLW